MLVLCRRRRPAADPVKQIGVTAFEQSLITVELAVIEAIDMRLGEAAKNSDHSRAFHGATTGTADVCGGYRMGRARDALGGVATGI